VRTPRYWVFLAITLLTPVALFAVAEIVARLVWPDGALPLFVTAPVGDGSTWPRTPVSPAGGSSPNALRPPP